MASLQQASNGTDTRRANGGQVGGGGVGGSLTICGRVPYLRPSDQNVCAASALLRPIKNVPHMTLDSQKRQQMAGIQQSF